MNYVKCKKCNKIINTKNLICLDGETGKEGCPYCENSELEETMNNQTNYEVKFFYKNTITGEYAYMTQAVAELTGPEWKMLKPKLCNTTKVIGINVDTVIAQQENNIKIMKQNVEALEAYYGKPVRDRLSQIDC